MCVGAYAVAFCACVLKVYFPSVIAFAIKLQHYFICIFFLHTQVPFAHGYEEYIPGVIGFANELQRYVVKQVRSCVSVLSVTGRCVDLCILCVYVSL